MLKKLCEGLDAVKIDKDGLEQPDNMARVAMIGKAFQHLPRIREIIAELNSTEVVLDDTEQELLHQIEQRLDDEHFGP